MGKFAILPIVAVLFLTACSKADDQSASAPSTDIQEAPAASAKGDASDKIDVGNGVSPTAAETPTPPQIAYAYAYGFRLPAKTIAPLQQRHADLCEHKGPTVCQIISMEQVGSEGDYVHGTLQLAVAANQARAFGKELGDAAKDADGEEISSSISGEDLSKQIVDTQARLRARTLLRDRLMELLANRKGTVAELVEAERDVAQVNEEIDQATSWLAEMRGRVAYSRITINYESGSPVAGGFLGPIRSALGNVTSILGMIIATLILILTILVPIAILVFLWRTVWPRMRPLLGTRPIAPTEDDAAAEKSGP
jgi:hypothetical protein